MRLEPWAEEANYQARLEREHKKYLRGCPWCCVCDEQIADAKCYQLNGDFDSCICEACYKAEVKKLRRSNIAVALREYIEESIFQDVPYVTTPHKGG